MRVWLINNYATPPRYGGLVRHSYFAKFFRQRGHDFRIFTSSQIHNTTVNMISGNEYFLECELDGVPYTFVRSMSYTKNNWRRIANMMDFPLHCKKAMKQLYASGEKPDVIYASSPMPLSSKTAFHFAEKRGIPTVFEVRDLWPKSIVDYSRLTDRNPIIRALYGLEASLYKRADRIIFTMAGGEAYLHDRGLGSVLRDKKIDQVNNGVDFEEFLREAQEYRYEDSDLEDAATLKIVYSGSIRHIYDFGCIVETAALCKKALPQARFLIYGDGTEREEMAARARAMGLQNIKFKGHVEKQFIPSILQRADLALLHHKQVDLARYGLSPNKLFEYLAAGCPVLSTVQSKYSLLKDAHCGFESPSQDPKEIAHAIQQFAELPEEAKQHMRNRARQTAEQHDYRVLSEKLENIFDELLEEKRGKNHA